MNPNTTLEVCALANGVTLPVVGLGLSYQRTARVKHDAYNSVKWAIMEGYTFFDTASHYGTEKDVGNAIVDSGIDRNSFLISTKLWPSDYGTQGVAPAFQKSIKNLRTSFLDIYLMHWPGSWSNTNNREVREETWREMEKLYDSEKCRAIGVSNFLVKHLEEMEDYASIMPHINQIEFNPFQQSKEIVKFCHSHSPKIQICGYCPLAKGYAISDPLVNKISAKYQKSPAQVLIRWSLQKGVVTIPKSSKRQRIKENFEVMDFVLNSEDMSSLDSLHSNLRVTWDPSDVL